MYAWSLASRLIRLAVALTLVGASTVVVAVIPVSRLLMNGNVDVVVASVWVAVVCHLL